MSQDKVFVAKTTVVNTKFGQIVKIALGPQDFEVLQNAKNDKGWVNLEMKDKRDGGKYIQLQGEYTGKAAPQAAAVNDGDDMPF
jgi:hypothetical protein